MWEFTFDWKANGYDPNNAYWLARLSRMAYRERPGIQIETDAFWGRPIVAFYDHEPRDAQACMLTYPEGALLAFRGTESRADWLTNVQVQKTRSGNLEYHSGFFGAVSQLLDCRPKPFGAIEVHRRKEDEGNGIYAPTLKKSLEGYMNGGKPVFLCGHSLGGAMACIAALVQPLDGCSGSGPQVYTYGQPRCVAKNGVAHIQAHSSVQVFQHVNNEDVVPRVPPRFLGYEHISLSHVYDKDGNLLTGTKLVKAQDVINKSRKLLNPAALSVADHAIGKYVGLIEETRWP